MENIKLQAATRQAEQKVGVPAELYGPGVTNRHLSVDEAVLEALLAKINKATLLDLVIDNDSAVPVLIRDVQREPVRNRILHVDFFQLDMNKKVKVEVEVQPVGKSTAISNLGATLVKNMQTVHVECLPKDLVSKVEVDLAALQKVDDVIRVEAIALPSGMVAVSQPRAVVFSLAASRRGRVAQAEGAAAPAAAAAPAKAAEPAKAKAKK